MFDFANGINIKIINSEYENDIAAFIDGLNLKVSAEIMPGKELKYAELLDYEGLDEEETKKRFIELLNELEITFLPSEDNEYNLDNLINDLFNGLYSSYKLDSISKLSDENFNSEDTLEVFSLIFRDLLNEKMIHHPVDATEILGLLCFNSFYRHSFYRRVALFIIKENWDEAKKIFWKLIKDNDHQRIFSNRSFRKELYELLKEQQGKLEDDEVQVIKQIIDQGPQINLNDKDPEYSDYWRLEWYSALKDIQPFLEDYQRLSLKFNTTNENIENIGKLQFRSGNLSVLTPDEILSMSNEKIVLFINQFNPKDHWEEPNIHGLSRTLEDAVSKEVKKFTDELYIYKNIGYQYVYSLLAGFRMHLIQKLI